MKKNFIILLFALLGIVTLHAQTQIAILSHSGENTVYHGADALNDAYEVAEDGDVITLSAGAFKSTEINKNITVRGAGMGIKLKETDASSETTELIGDLFVHVVGDSNNHFTMEGISTHSRLILGTSNHLQFIKCHLGDVGFSSGTVVDNCNLTHVYVSNNFISGGLRTTLSAIGCVFNYANFAGRGYLFSLTNCIIKSDIPESIVNTSIKNSILIFTETDASSFTTNTSIYNSLWVGQGNANPFNESEVKRHNYIGFPNLEGAFKENTLYELTDKAKECKGDDNTEIGIYGGALPFSPVSSNKRITKFEVAPETTSDGKLHVNIKVE